MSVSQALMSGLSFRHAAAGQQFMGCQEGAEIGHTRTSVSNHMQRADARLLLAAPKPPKRQPAGGCGFILNQV